MKNFSQVLQQSYLEIPEQAAIYMLHSHQPEQVITYRTLVHSSANYARALAQAGTQPGDVVILILQHSQDLISAFFGAILRGAIPSIMPFLTEKLLPEQYRSSLSALFEITSPSIVITYEEFVDEVRNACQGTSVRSVLVAEEVARQIPSTMNIVNESLQPKTLQGVERSPDDIVLLQHSSGTTGLQKGVALSHRAVFNQLESYSRSLHLRKTDVIVSWLPLYHDMGLIAGFIMPVLSRVPLVLMSPFDWVRAPYRLLQAISRYRGTLCWLPNFAYNFCAQKVRDRDLENVDLSSLRAVINCSEPMHWKSHAMFLERFQPYGFQPEALATSYAMAENVFAVTQGGIDTPVTLDIIDMHDFSNHQVATPVKDDLTNNASNQATLPVKMLSAGYPIEGTKVRVINAKGKDLPERHIGQIALQSDCMLTGYFHRPDLTKKAFLEGWYLTGDLGYLAEGQLYVTGRMKDLIIVGGKNIYPQDLERLAGEVEGVHPGRVVAFGVFNEQIGTEDIIIIAESDIDLSNPEKMSDQQVDNRAEMIATEIRRRVTRGSDITLRYVYVVERNWLIKTSSGKVARQANKTRYLAELVQYK
jgi:fatty-acyl-CoA synthase